jgi:hypothetical protein
MVLYSGPTFSELSNFWEKLTNVASLDHEAWLCEVYRGSLIAWGTVGAFEEVHKFVRGLGEDVLV